MPQKRVRQRIEKRIQKRKGKFDQDYKMTTPIPRGIELPDKLETRLGTLNFFYGSQTNPASRNLYNSRNGISTCLHISRATRVASVGVMLIEPSLGE
jgi:hypothetical protein